MWLLRNDDKGLLYRVTPGRQHVVSRKDGELLLIGDQSISRKHAQVFVDDENVDDGIVLKDLGSKYGTFVIIGEGDLSQLTPNDQIKLKSGDCVRFGIQWNTWRAEFVPLLVATSTLTHEEKSAVTLMVGQLGGQVIENWRNTCTHLTMNQLTVTVKVVCALAAGQPIVKPDYWNSLIQSLSSMQSTLPNCKDYLPPLAESMLNPSEVSFEPNPERSKLFLGYTFVASSPKQLSRIKKMVVAAGGNAVEYSSRLWTVDRLVEDKVILMLHSANDKPGSQQSQVSEGYIPIARKLKALGVRCIPESEIGYSVLYCSMSQYCNPHNAPDLLGNSSSVEATQPVTVICPNTEDSTTTNSPRPDSKNSSAGISTVPAAKKRIREDSSEDENQSNKRPDVRENSEDLFGSQSLNGQISATPKSLKLKSSKKSVSPNDTAGSKENMPVTFNCQSVDMFAPSVEKSIPSNPRENEVLPSCEDLFSSVVNKTPQNKQFGSNENNNIVKTQHKDVDDDFSFASKKRSRTVQHQTKEENDEFAFTSSKRPKKALERKTEQKDEFSFVSSRILDTTSSDPVDEFSFVSNKRKTLNLVDKTANEEDEFSFVSNKRSSKRPVQSSSPDIFASSSGSATSNSNHSKAGPSNASNSAEKDEFRFQERKRNPPKDNLFVVPSEPVSKRRRNESLLNLDEPDSEIKIALFSKEGDNSAGPSNLPTEIQQNAVEQPEEKNLVTYSKPIPIQDMKKEVEDKEIDELANELNGTTIVVVTPLIVKRERLADTSTAATGKNFKKFQKVMWINKRSVPHIIGGNDLVPHNEMVPAMEEEDEVDLIPPHRQETSEDDFAFQQTKKRGKAR